MNYEVIDRHITNLRDLLAFLKDLRIGDVPAPAGDVPAPAAAAPPPPPPVPTPPVPSPTDPLLDLLNSAEWPQAVDPSLICDDSSEEEKMYRADAILDLAQLLPMDNKKFLDFGCGEGHVVRKAKSLGAAAAVGYDIEAKNWNSHQPLVSATGEVLKYTLTTSQDAVRAEGPYDLVLIYDVIDHIINQEPQDALKLVAETLAPNGRIFVRCHPWCSRHGTHLYKNLNKAYAHLVFSEEELKNLGHEGIATRHIIHPIAMYNGFFAETGLRVVEQIPTLSVVEPFFMNNPMLAPRIKANWKTSDQEALRNGTQFPEAQMAQQFVDYILTKA